MTPRAIAVYTLLSLLCLIAPAPSGGPPGGPAHAIMPPLKVAILDANEAPQGTAWIYSNYIELEDETGDKRGAIGVMLVQGRAELFLVQSDPARSLVGFGKNYRIYNTKDQIVGYYYWTPIWSYVYDPKMKKVGQAQCLAYQGVCAAGIAGFLLGLY